VVIARDNVKSRGAGADATLEETHEAVGTVNREIVGRTHVPRARQLFVRLDRVVTDRIRSIAGTYMKHHSRFARVDVCQDSSMGRSVDRPRSFQLIGHGTREANAFFLRRHTEDHVSPLGFERFWEVVEVAYELCLRREKTISVRQADDGSVIRVLK